MADKELTIPEKQLVQQAMLRVWAIGQGAFGETWVFKYGTVKEPSFKVWCRRLQYHPPELVAKYGEELLMRWSMPRPPTLGEFAENLRILINQHSSRSNVPALTHKRPDGTSETAERELNRIAEIIGKPRLTPEELLERRDKK